MKWMAWVAIVALLAGCSSDPVRPPRTATVAQSVQPEPAEPVPTATPEPPTPVSDVSFLDVGSGRLTPLPLIDGVTYNIGHVQASPEGSRLAFQDDDQIYVTNVDGSETISLGEGSAPWWSPNGEEIVYQKDSAIFIVEVSTGRSRQVFDGWAYHPNFSPDGKRILFTWIGPGTRGFALWTIPVGGGTPVALPLPHTKHTFPAFGTYSPDGSQIAFRKTNYDGFDFTEMTQASIWVTDADGSNPRGLGRVGAWMSQGDATRLWPTWSPNGMHIAFEPMYARGIRIVDANSGDLETSVPGANPTWVDNNTLIVET